MRRMVSTAPFHLRLVADKLFSFISNFNGGGGNDCLTVVVVADFLAAVRGERHLPTFLRFPFLKEIFFSFH